jgi:hypothetical protein
MLSFDLACIVDSDADSDPQNANCLISSIYGGFSDEASMTAL